MRCSFKSSLNQRALRLPLPSLPILVRPSLISKNQEQNSQPPKIWKLDLSNCSSLISLMCLMISMRMKFCILTQSNYLKGSLPLKTPILKTFLTPRNSKKEWRESYNLKRKSMKKLVEKLSFKKGLKLTWKWKLTRHREN